MSVNKAIIIGRLGVDPEIKQTPSGVSVCNFTVATSEKYTDKAGNKQENTEWHRIVAWKKTADFCHKWFKKGQEIYIEGAIQTRSWDNKEGVKQYTTEINAFRVDFIGIKSDNTGGDTW